MARRTLGTIAATTALLTLAACYQVPQSTAASGETGSISAGAQAAGSSVTVAEIGMPSTGWLVVHAVRDGQPDFSGSIGHAYVPAGPSKNVAVSLSEPQSAGSSVVAMLHLDTGVARVYEFANGSTEPHDLPVMKDGKPVMTTIQLN